MSITSDNGTNFVGAACELRELLLNLDKDKIQCRTAQDGVQWHFNPPAGPHFGEGSFLRFFWRQCSDSSFFFYSFFHACLLYYCSI